MVLVGPRTHDELDRKAHIDEVAIRRNVKVLELIEERRSLVPGHVRGRVDDVVAAEGGDRDERDVEDGQAGREILEFGTATLEDIFREIDQVHLVHADDRMRNAEE